MSSALDVIKEQNIVTSSSWLAIKNACISLQSLQDKDGSVLDAQKHRAAADAVAH